MAKTIVQLIADEKKAIRDYGEKAKDNPALAKILLHIQSEEKEHAKELGAIKNKDVKMAEDKKKKVTAGALMTKEEPDAKKKEEASAPKPKKSEKKEEKKEKKPKHRHTHIEHLDDGSHVIRRTPREGGDEVTSSAPDNAGLIANMQSNLGGGEGAEEAAEQSSPSPEPAPGM